MIGFLHLQHVERSSMFMLSKQKFLANPKLFQRYCSEGHGTLEFIENKGLNCIVESLSSLNSKMDSNIDILTKRLDVLSKEFQLMSDNLTSKSEARFVTIGADIKVLAGQIDSNFKASNASISQIDSKYEVLAGQIDSNFKGSNASIGALEKKVDSVEEKFKYSKYYIAILVFSGVVSGATLYDFASRHFKEEAHLE